MSQEWKCSLCGAPADYSHRGTKKCAKHWDPHGEPKKFSIIFPTRERPALLEGIIKSLVINTAVLADIEVLVAYDEDDQITKDYITKCGWGFIQWYERKRSMNFSRDYYNFLFKQSTGRWIIVCNDDAEFRTYAWDKLAYDELKDQSNVIMGWIEDGLGSARQFDNGNYCCFPLIGREGAEALGYIFPDTLPTWGADIWVRKLYDQIASVAVLPITIFHINHWNQSRPQDHVNKRIQDNHMPVDTSPKYAEINKLLTAKKRSMAHAG